MKSKNKWAKKEEKLLPDLADTDKSGQEIVTITVAECGEFENLLRIYKGIMNVDDALHIFLRLLQKRRMGFPSISVHVRKNNDSYFEGARYEVFSGNMIDLTPFNFSRK